MKFEKRIKKSLDMSRVDGKENFDKLMKRIDLNLVFSEFLFADIKQGVVNTFDDISCEEYLNRIKAAGYEVSDPTALLADMRDKIDDYETEYESMKKMKNAIKK